MAIDIDDAAEAIAAAVIASEGSLEYVVRGLIEAAQKEERGKVVAWLRDAGRYAPIDVVERRGLYELIAQDVESGEHLAPSAMGARA